MTSGPLEGKVAQILTERELIVNVGSRDGVTKGTTFAVLAVTPIEVRDPDTGERLGEMEREKVRVRVTELQERFSVCSTFEKVTIAGRGLQSYIGSIDLMGTPNREVLKTLKVSDSSYPPPLEEKESYVKVGDKVKAIESAT